MSYLSFLARSSAAITPSDTALLPKAAEGIYVGGAGNIELVHTDGTEGIFYGAVAGTVLPFAIRQVKASGTTATNLRALFKD